MNFVLHTVAVSNILATAIAHYKINAKQKTDGELTGRPLSTKR